MTNDHGQRLVFVSHSGADIDIYLGQLRGRTQRNPIDPDEEVK